MTIMAWPNGWTVYATATYGVSHAVSDDGSRTATVKESRGGVVVTFDNGDTFTRYTFGDAMRHLERLGVNQ